MFFCCHWIGSKIPDGYVIENFCGFVEELVINDDPEYQWIDKIRTPRTSNETRQKLFSKLSGELQRRIGLKVLDMDANCVLGYLQNFDLEGEHGIVVRGIGTAACIVKQASNSKFQNQKNLSNQTPPISSPNTTSPISSIQNQFNYNLNNSNNSSNSNNEHDSINDKQKVSNGTTNHTNGNNINSMKLSKVSPSRIITRIHSDSDINSYHAAQQQLANLTQPLGKLCFFLFNLKKAS